MQIVSLKIKNFLSLSDVDLKPGKVTQITGANSQGKTSILKALQFATKGSSDGTLVKNGEDQAEVIIELDDQTVIRRRIRADGKQTVSIRKGEFEAKSPQTILDTLFQDSAFNPLDLLDPSKRHDAIMSSIDLKVDAETLAVSLQVENDDLPPIEYNQHGLKVLEQAHKFYYQRRAEANKDAELKKKRWETYLADLPKEEVLSVTRGELERTLKEMHDNRSAKEKKALEIAALVQKAKESKHRVETFVEAMNKIDTDIAKLESGLEQLLKRKREGQGFLDKAKSEIPAEIPSNDLIIKEIQDISVEIERTKAKFSDIDKQESIAKQKTMIEEMKVQYETSKQFAETLSARVAALAGPIKKDLLASVGMPIKGLSYSEGKFTVDGFPVENLSTSLSMKLALSVARRLASKTKLICLDGAESLDEESYKTLRDEIENDGFNYFITRVGKAFDEPRHKVVTMSHGQAIQ